ncbi:MAG: hypothetical protein JW745_07825 [Sedimentisphaerales bacterium]|nr:hypothetical protein [Sedimentisphaerales bacterium]MBN2841757.1 hypothetical protein [Sedimentisphaerales bacterium]
MECFFAPYLAVPDITCFTNNIGTALAYLDPGSGAMIFQLIIASVAGMAVGIKLFWRNIVAIFTGKKSEQEQSEQQGTDK